MLPPRLDLNLLKSLDVLLAERNVTRAARRLGLSQPALSAQLRQLRETFGDPLLIPAARGMTPTARAESLREPLREALAGLVGLMIASQPFEPGTATRTFRIVASDAIHCTVSTPLAQAMAEVAPGCRLALLPYDGARTLEQMSAGEVDLWFGARPSVPPTLRARRLYAETFLCVMDRALATGATPLDVERFCQLRHVLVSPSGGGFRGTLDDALFALGRERQVALSLNSFLLVPEVILGSAFIATVPARLARGWADRLAVCAPPCEVAAFEVMMAWHPRAHADPAQLWLRDLTLSSLPAGPY